MAPGSPSSVGYGAGRKQGGREGEQSERVDPYSLGVLLVFLVMGVMILWGVSLLDLPG